MKQTRRAFLSLALPLAACSGSQQDSGSPPPATATGSSSPSQPLLKLNAYHVPSLCLLGSRVAVARGFFAAEGLDVQLFPPDTEGGHNHNPIWLNGPNGRVRADISTAEYALLSDMALDKIDYYVVAGEHSGCRQLVVPASSPIRTLADLKGKRVGLPPFNDSIMWSYLLRQAGVDPKSVAFVENGVPPGGDEEIAYVNQEFAANRLDAYVTVDPSGEILKEQGRVRLLASNTWTAPLNRWYCCMITVRRAIIDAHPEVAGKVTRAYRQAAAFIEDHPAEAIDLSIKAGYMPANTRRDIGARLIKEYEWATTGRIEEDLERYCQLLIEAERLPASASAREIVSRVYRSGA